jgi:membrane-associated phospholipid phosphatase
MVMVSLGLGAGVALASSASCESWKPSIEFAYVAAWNLGINTMSKKLVGRPRPYTEGAGFGGSQGEAEDYRSFYSGHTSNTSLGVTYALGTLMRAKESKPILRIVIPTAAGLAAGFGTGSQRVAGGRHYWSDVAVGALAGTVFGMAPFVHEIGATRLSTQGASGVTIGLQPVRLPGTERKVGMGLSLSGDW